jgi:hypothetical protein
VGSTTSQALGHCGLGADDGAAGPGMVRVDGVVGSGTMLGAQRRGLKEDNVVVGSGMALRAWVRCMHGRRCQRLGSGKMVVRKGALTMVRNDDAEAPERTR